MNEAERFATVRTKVAEVIAKATAMYHVDLSNLHLAMNTRGTTAGWAGCKWCNGAKLYTLKFNSDMILNGSFDYICNDTVPHEVAHLVCIADPSLGRSHNRGWQRVCLALGGNGKRCHSEEVEYAFGGFDYLTDRGHKVTVSKIRHQKIQAGKRYTWRGGKGGVSNRSPFCEQGGVMPASLPVVAAPVQPMSTADRLWYEFRNNTTSMPPVLPPTQPLAPTRSVAAGSMSKAEQVRIWIREAKQNGSTQASVANKAVLNLSMSKAQAARYVLENWVKV